MIGARTPGPKTFMPGGHLFAFRRDPLNFLRRAALAHGDVVRLRFGPQTAFLLNHPDLIRDVLVTRHDNFVKGPRVNRAKWLVGEGLFTSEGELHRRQRRLVLPAFHRQRIAAYAETFAAHGARLREEWRDGQTVEVAREMAGLTMGVIVKTLFGVEVGPEARRFNETLSRVLRRGLTPPSLSARLLRKLRPGKFDTREHKRALDAVVYGIIEERRRDGVADRGDFLSMLLLARDEEDGGRGGGMSDRQVRDEVMTAVVAGHETTANLLTWTWHLLAEHPEAEARLHDELERVLAGRLPAAEDQPRLTFTEMILAESMRLYPPGWIVSRAAVGEHDAGGHTLPAGSLVLLSQYVTHHDPRWFPDPFRFDPGRWTPEAKESRPQFSFFPFSGGPRRCIGEGLAWMEATLLLATLAQRWRLRPVPGRRVEPDPQVSLRPKHGIRMRLERR